MGLALALVLAWIAIDSGPGRARLREAVGRALASRVPGARLEGGARLDWRLRLVAGPIAVRSRPTDAPTARIERAIVRPRVVALLAGRLEPAAVSLQGVQVDAGFRGAALAALLEAWGAVRSGPAVPRGRSGAAAPEIRLEDLRVRGALSGRPGAADVEIGPLSGRARLERAGPEAVAELDLVGAGGVRGRVRIGVGGGRRDLSAHVDRLAASAIPAPLRSLLPFGVEGGALSVALEAPLLARAARGAARVEIAVDGLALRLESRPPGPRGEAAGAAQSDALAPGVVGPLAARIAGTLRWDADARRLSLAPARLELGSARAAADVALSFEARPEPRFELELRAQDVDWKAALEALPAMLRPPPEAPAVQGSLAGWLRVSGPVERTASWRLDGDVDPSRLEPAGNGGLALPFTWLAPLPGGGSRPVAIGPANPDFVPLGALPAYVVRAVLASEDAGFYAHHGFDLHEIQDALARADERPRLRGASTITQQLAKNLFLSPERTLLRKAREALATIALEASVGKRRLLEIYLNLAEWGPGVYGIGEAARHWFGKDARALSPKEAAFLASVIPNPIRYEMYRRRGALTELWEERVRQLLVKLRAADVLTPEQLREAWDAPLEFRG